MKNQIRVISLLAGVAAAILCAGFTEADQNLAEGVKNGDIELVRSALADGAKVDGDAECTPDNPLISAITGNHDEIAVLLIESGAQINVKDANLRIPLHYAVIGGKTPLVTLLLQKGARVNAQDQNRLTALHYAANGGDVGIVRDDSQNPDEKTLLSAAADELKWTGIAALLIDRNADVNAETIFHVTPLFYAAISGRAGVAKLLIDRGADVNGATHEGKTPLHYAAEYGNFDVVKLLLKHGADRTLKDSKGQTPFDLIGNVRAVDVDALEMLLRP